MASRQLKISDMFFRAAEAKLSKTSGAVKRSAEDAGIDDSTNVSPKRSPLSSINVNALTEKTVGTPSSPMMNPIEQSLGLSTKPINTEKLCDTGKAIVGTLKDAGWHRVLRDELTKPYVNEIFLFLENECKKKVKIFPPRDLVFNAFNLTPFDNIRVVLIGQDPYHNDGQAHGLCFSVPKGITPPPSLKNIYNEISEEYPDFRAPDHGCLVPWARQGIFMLNATLTVEAHKANSHSTIGWQKFTDAVIKSVSLQSKRGIVFLLWGGFAHKKETLIDTKRHKVIKEKCFMSIQRIQNCFNE